MIKNEPIIFLCTYKLNLLYFLEIEFIRKFVMNFT